MGKSFFKGLSGGTPPLFDFKDKSKAVNIYVEYMLARTQSMFRYSGLPENIPQRVLELYLQTNGNVCFYDFEGELYVFTGGIGGEPNAYYMPTIYTVSNPYLKFSKNLKIDEECVVVSSDSLYIGLVPMFSKYASLMVENDISMRLVNINTRIMSLLSAPDDRTYKSALKYLADVEKGELGVIGETPFLDGVKSQPYAPAGSHGGMTNLIEYQQYLKAGWFNELGLQSNYNMKRESINSNEAQLNVDALIPLVDDMLNCRKIGVEKVNAMFGTNITVDLASVWAERDDSTPNEEYPDVSGQPENNPKEEVKPDEIE